MDPALAAPGRADADQPERPFCGAAKSADEMARAETRKRQWGQFLAIADGGKSTWEGDLEGATAYVNKNRVTLTTDFGSRTVDTDGMTRSDIVGWARWAMQQIHGFEAAPKPRESESNSRPSMPTAKEVKEAAKEADRNPTDGQKEAGNYKMGHIQWQGLDITIETAKGAVSGKRHPARRLHQDATRAEPL